MDAGMLLVTTNVYWVPSLLCVHPILSPFHVLLYFILTTNAKVGAAACLMRKLKYRLRNLPQATQLVIVGSRI